MLRDKDFKSLEGQAAFLFYKSWLVEKHKSRVIGADAFKSSKYYNQFRKFVDFVRTVEIVDTTLFIKLMVKERIEPPYWREPDVYGKYLNYITRKLSADKWIELTVNTLFDITDAGEAHISEAFQLLTPCDVIRLLEQRKLSPWVLLNSRKFANFFRTRTTGEEKIIMEKLINPDYWKPRFINNPEDLKLAKKTVIALELD